MSRKMDQMVGYHVNLVSHFLKNRYNKNLSEIGLTVSQAKVLYHLVNHGAQTQSDLQKLLYVKGSTMNGIVESMLKQQLIIKKDSTEDRRTKVIELTEKGRAQEQKLWNVISQLDDDLTKGMSEEEQKLLISWLKKLQGNIHEQTDGGKESDAKRTE
ncbi:MarR family winged helix-turn-helix transcriptional regulator [Alteribacter keqinensis]|uniref:MarR family transcriptional regulator n=1 Tax=Alteribacter keqinensis TaxID=2483800 RepID=A0A3M7TLD7_9BACI|nr:MarR family transcriptional regulator [Alteribacter keqinensis]RNA66288.1 MarR family transcriptional regulator [Alteribacter keqinensis]